MSRDTHFIRSTKCDTECVTSLMTKPEAAARFQLKCGMEWYDRVEWCRVNRKGEIVIVAKRELAQ